MNIPWNIVSTILTILISVMLALGLFVLNGIRNDIDSLTVQGRQDKAELNTKLDDSTRRLQERYEQSNTRIEDKIDSSVNQSETRQQQSLNTIQSQVSGIKSDINSRMDTQESRINNQLDRQTQQNQSIVELIYTSSQTQLERIARLEESIKPLLLPSN